MSIVIMSPPAIVHNDIVVYENEDTLEHIHLDYNHEKLHHKNDSEHDKKTEHHHHCSVKFSSFLAILFPLNNFQTISIPYHSPPITFYQKIYNSSYLDGIFQPPRV